MTPTATATIRIIRLLPSPLRRSTACSTMEIPAISYPNPSVHCTFPIVITPRRFGLISRNRFVLSHFSSSSLSYSSATSVSGTRHTAEQRDGNEMQDVEEELHLQLSSGIEMDDNDVPPKSSPCLEPGLYLVATPIGNLEDITLRALRILRSADVILSEDTRHSGKLLQYYNIKTPLLSYHKFNEYQREMPILKRLHEGQIVALISDAGTPGISDPGMELTKSCVSENIRVIPIPGPSALVAALSASGLLTNEFTFVGFLSKHASSRVKRLTISASESTAQIFFVPPHKLCRFLEEASPLFGDTRFCVIAREITKVHEEFWRGTLGEARKVFTDRPPRGEITLLLEGNVNPLVEIPTEAELEIELEKLMSKGQSLSMAVKLVSEGMSVKKKQVYAIALRKLGKKIEAGKS